MSNDYIRHADSENIYVWGSESQPWPVHALCTQYCVHRACTGNTVCLDALIYMFLESAWHIWDNFWRKKKFHPPFGFQVICPLVFGLREGFIFKLESSGFHQTLSFCGLQPPVDAKNQTPKFWFYHPPVVKSTKIGFQKCQRSWKLINIWPRYGPFNVGYLISKST